MSEIPTKVRKALAERSGGWCEVRVAEVCVTRAVHAHHKRRADRPDDNHHEDRMLHCCFPCHHFLHLNPALAYQEGWLEHA